MGGYDCILFRKDDKIPDNIEEFNKCVKNKMLREYGSNECDFNSIWYNENSTFTLHMYENEIWGQLDW